MVRDWLFGIVMALAVAIVPNVIHAIATGQDLSFADRLWVIASLAAGAALASPLAFGIGRPKASGRLVKYGYPALLIVAGIGASAYFLAVVGFEVADVKAEGLGAGVAEALDSSLAPCFYIVFVYFFIARRKRLGDDESTGEGSRIFSRKVLAGSSLVVVGLFTMGLTIAVSGGDGEQVSQVSGTGQYALSPTDAILAAFGVIGALGTAVSLWTLRRLVRDYHSSLGFAVLLRYGGVAVAFLAAALVAGGQDLPAVGWKPLVFALVSGAVLVNGAFLAAVRIDNELVQAAAMGLTPLLAVLVEVVLASTSPATSRLPLDHVGLWLGAVATMFGIILLNRDPATKAR